MDEIGQQAFRSPGVLGGTQSSPEKESNYRIYPILLSSKDSCHKTVTNIPGQLLRLFGAIGIVTEVLFPAIWLFVDHRKMGRTKKH
jgi:hypothetical protein